MSDKKLSKKYGFFTFAACLYGKDRAIYLAQK